jgi:hypothetical protein
MYRSVALVILVTTSGTWAGPPSEKISERAATRWLTALKAGQSKAAATLVAPDVEVSGAPCEIQKAHGRAAFRRAVPEWRNCIEFVPTWTAGDVGPNWRELTTKVDGESYGTMTVRVSRTGLIAKVAIQWSWGGE